MARSIGLILASVLFSAGGQLALKAGMTRVGVVELAGVAGVGRTLARMFTTPLVLVGLACYALSATLWMFVLSRMDLSLAYPMVALLYVFIPIASWLLLGEEVPPLRWVGILIVMVGVYIISRT